MLSLSPLHVPNPLCRPGACRTESRVGMSSQGSCHSIRPHLHLGEMGGDTQCPQPACDSETPRLLILVPCLDPLALTSSIGSHPTGCLGSTKHRLGNVQFLQGLQLPTDLAPVTYHSIAGWKELVCLYLGGPWV